MPELVVVEKIDGNPVAWRCSVCRQGFSVRGKFTANERTKQVNAAFRLHQEESHPAKGAACDITHGGNAYLS
jgi:hypothetical protein